jgi:hypothetical protein
MVTIQIENDELALYAGDQQLRVALPSDFRAAAGKGALSLAAIGTSQTSAVLSVVGGADLLIGGAFVGIAGDYKQCKCVISPPFKMTPGQPYPATAVLEFDTSAGDSHTVNIKIGA